jgi:ketosteroid isomerase-like protein
METQDTAELWAKIRELEARLQQVEEDRAIRELLARYGFNADRGRSEAYVSLYTEDGVIDTSDTRRWEGHAELMDFITDPQGHAGMVGRCMHVQGNNLVTHIDGDTASAEAYSVVLMREEDGYQVLICNANRWTLEKANGTWQIRERFIRNPGSDGFMKAFRD